MEGLKVLKFFLAILSKVAQRKVVFGFEYHHYDDNKVWMHFVVNNGVDVLDINAISEFAKEHYGMELKRYHITYFDNNKVNLFLTFEKKDENESNS